MITDNLIIDAQIYNGNAVSGEWGKDARDEAGISSGRGWAVSASWEVGERWLPFVRFGSSDGGAGVAAEDALSGGFQYTVRSDQKWSLGGGWARPSRETHSDDVDDEYVIETSYNVQVARNFALLPDLRLVIDRRTTPTRIVSGWAVHVPLLRSDPRGYVT